jgi:asparagine synthase (glutamine-hydrolysing)
MCGIVGLVTTEGRCDCALSSALSRIAHRGPDDSGQAWWTCGEYAVGLASRRLSILDLSPAGHMPMTTDDGTIAIVYNGEVYNFQELRQGLENRGYRFRSAGDTEVLLQLYRDEGPEFVRRLNGIFAFAIWDQSEGRLMIARDRFGIKPLYWRTEGPRCWFASEIKSLLAFPGIQAEVDPVAAETALTFLGVTGDQTGFKRIRRLLPGHYGIWQAGRFSTTAYWAPQFPADRPVSAERELEGEFRDLLQRVVRRQMISDVPLGAFLSGGLDSSALVAMMARAHDQPVNTFTIVYRAQDQVWERTPSEAPYARQMADAVGARHREIVVEPDVVDLLPKIAWHLDEPIGDPAAVSTYLICTAARRELTVLLAGQGADELFAGYHFYSANHYSQLYGRVPRLVGSPVAGAASWLARAVSSSAPQMWRGRLLAAQRYGDLILDNAYRAPAERHAAFHAYFTRTEKDALYTSDFAAAVSPGSSMASYEHLFQDTADLADLNRQLSVDIRTHLPDLILNYTDKLGMAASTEVRVPFLDNEVVDFASRLPVELKLKGGTGKYVFRQAMEGIPPPPILTRRKAPFGVPVRSWLRRDLRPMIDELLSESAVRRRGYFNYPAVRGIVERGQQSLGKSAHQLWALLMFEIWHRVFIDRTITP